MATNDDPLVITVDVTKECQADDVLEIASLGSGRSIPPETVAAVCRFDRQIVYTLDDRV